MKYEGYRAEVGIHFRTAQNKAFIRQGNARLEANAETKLRAGDYEGFVASYDKMTLPPDVREDRIRQGLEQGTYKIANNQLDAIQELPPAQQVPAVKAYLADLTAKGKDGRFLNYEFDRGGLSLGGRVNLEAIANARIREANRAMDVNGRRIVSELRAGRATIADVDAAVREGALDEETAKALAPELAIAQEELDAKKEAKAQALAQKQDAATERLRTDVLSRGQAGRREIEKQMALGEIGPEQAAKLIGELDQAARSEQALVKGEYQQISERIKGGFAQKLFGRQPSDAEYRSIQNEIIRAGVTKESRLKLMDELFQAKLADIADLQEDGPDDGRWLDRDISPTERDMRREVVKSYRELLPALGDTLAGATQAYKSEGTAITVWERP